jgi:hypothetical protein
MPREAAEALREAEEVVLIKGRTYPYHGRYLQIQVFTKWLTEVNLLVQRFGGNYYKHGTGFVWVLANRQKLLQMVDALQEKFPSENGFENEIIKRYK